MAVALVGLVTAAYRLLFPLKGDGDAMALFALGGLGLMCGVVGLPFLAFWLLVGKGDSPPPDSRSR